ncbi:hypothetical protein SAMCFNEI73_pA0048 (plasmid) [Sinorhizobium americanum]|uniref:Transposase n=1 Tax=Sinorhizobium americanum TaxID=194963 RepID=A0A1L3LSG5_9HYPH|nr:hypothetical protein SAMCFNEI73_pA0048 [Sinorhizobium americanum]
MKNRLDARFDLDPLEVRGKLASDLRIRNSDATIDDHF